MSTDADISASLPRLDEGSDPTSTDDARGTIMKKRHAPMLTASALTALLGVGYGTTAVAAPEALPVGADLPSVAIALLSALVMAGGQLIQLWRDSRREDLLTYKSKLEAREKDLEKLKDRMDDLESETLQAKHEAAYWRVSYARETGEDVTDDEVVRLPGASGREGDG